MADLIRHSAETHAQVAGDLSKSCGVLDELEKGLNTIAQQLAQPHVWTGAAAETFQEKHRVLMKSVTDLSNAVKAIDTVRQGAHENILGANDRVTRAFET